MQVTRARFGEHVTLDPLEDGGMAFWHLRNQVRIDDPTRTVGWDDRLHDPPAMDRTPFERADFGGCDRLAWPRGAVATQFRFA